jgi:hypothetical protein
LVKVLDRVTMQLFVRGYCTMIAAPVQCDVDGIPKRSHYARVPPMGQTSKVSRFNGANRKLMCPAPLGCITRVADICRPRRIHSPRGRRSDRSLAGSVGRGRLWDQSPLDFVGESLIGRARWPNHNGSLQEDAWRCPTTLPARDNWERKVIRDETDDTCGDMGRGAVRSHRRWAYARDCEPARQRARTGGLLSRRALIPSNAA